MFLEVAVGSVAVLATSLLSARLFYPPLWRDLYTLMVTARMIRATVSACQRHELIIDTFEDQARLHPDRKFILFNDDVYTYNMVDKMATRVARALLHLKVYSGDTVALVMGNHPAFVWIFLGVQKIGARICLVNHHLVSEALVHTLTTCSPQLIIVGDGLDTYLPAAVAGVRGELDPNIMLYSYNVPREGVDLPVFQELMDSSSTCPVDPALRAGVQLTDAGAFIFTSGTTGFPKAAIISHKRSIANSHYYAPFGFSQSDVMYLPLPLYHASALNLALLNVINVGATVALKEKFSVSTFWQDCVKYKVTSVQYIGEMLRYLVNAPVCEAEHQHKLTYVIGNGLRADIWGMFRTRFNIPTIYEFYGSTDLPVGTINIFNIAGSVGRLSPLVGRLMGAILVQVEVGSGKPYRDSSGRCLQIQPGECGVLLARLSKRVRFDGYLGPASHTKERLIQDVLWEGDFYVNTNDVFYLDADYNLFFRERLGDSYRWKGENVCTADVVKAINHAEFVQDTNVFGVPVPGCEGKAGMAAITLKEPETLCEDKMVELKHLCASHLPRYAKPRFLRFQRQMSLTSTFKHDSLVLAKEGFDPKVVDEPLYYLDPGSDNYSPLNEDAYEDIVDGKIRL